MTPMVAILYRDGAIVRRIEDATPCDAVVVACAEPMVGRAADLGPILPVQVLVDRYNPKYEHYFLLVERRRDIYKRSGYRRGADGECIEMFYEYEKTETYQARDYYP